MATYNLFIHSSVEGTYEWLPFLAITDNGAVSICAQVFVWTHVVMSLVYEWNCWVICDSMFNLGGKSSI